jgi:hypothetical protein
MQAWLKIRRNQAILGGLIVVLLAAAYFLVLKPGGGSDTTGPVTLPSPAASGQPPASPVPGQKNKNKKNSNKSTLVLTGRNPFQCIVCPPVQKSSDSSGTGGTTPQTVTSNGLYAGGSVTNVAGHTVSIHSTYKRQGVIHARVTVDGTTFAPQVGQRFGNYVKLVSAGGSCARILYGDSSFTLCA